jgi:hypothetical protein
LAQRPGLAESRCLPAPLVEQQLTQQLKRRLD